MKIAWLTDPHLNFASIPRAEALMAEVRQWGAGALVVTGDIGEAPDLEGWLELMRARAGAPVYFVLGNHDYYRSSIGAVRAQVRQQCAGVEGLVWLSESEPIALTKTVGLVGHDGWGDARCGDFEHSRIFLSDFTAIDDLRLSDRAELKRTLEALGDEAAEHLRRACEDALRRFEHVLVATHVPPFVEAAWYEGTQSDEQWSPFFVCEAAGRALREVMARHPARRMTVLCGHTHSGGDAWVAPNIHVRTGAAVYRKPALQAPLWV
ncbi:MAG: metallophosphoesterase [Myxococcota bacterium]